MFQILICLNICKNHLDKKCDFVGNMYGHYKMHPYIAISLSKMNYLCLLQDTIIKITIIYLSSDS